MSDDDAEVRELLSRALSHHEAGEIEPARDLYLKILEQDPRHAQALDLAGVLCMQCDQLDAAQDFFEAALEVEPDEPRFLCHAGTLELKRANFAKAEALLQDAAERDGEYGEPHFYLALSARVRGELDRAAGELDLAVAADQGNALFLTWRGIVAKEQEDLHAAVSFLEQALSLGENNVDAWFHLGDTMEMLDDPMMAERCFRRSAELLPDTGLIIARLGRNLAAQGRWEEARDEHRRGLALDSEDAENWSGLALVLHDLGEDAEAAEAAETAVRIDPENVYGHLALSRIRGRAGDTDGAEAATAKVRELAKDDPTILAQLY